MTSPGNPSAHHLVWPVSNLAIGGSWDGDSALRPGQKLMPFERLHIPYEPMTTPRIALDSDGIRYPVPAELQPRLAERWTADDSYRIWTITLRQGVKSHAGNELTSSDVKWSWDRTYALKGIGVWRSRRLGGLDSSAGVEIVDRYTVRFTLSAPNPEWPQYLIFTTSNVFDSVEAKRHASADDPWATAWLTDHVAGYGAFDLEDAPEGVLSFRARPDYWAGAPGVDGIDQIGVDSRNDGLKMIERGDANLILGLYPEELARFENRPGFRTYLGRASHSSLEFNWLAAPFDDHFVRQAVRLAVPYDKIVEQVYDGHANRNKSPLTNTARFYTEEFWKYDTNLAAARALMKQSAHPDGFETELYVFPSYESLRFAEILRAALAPLGILIETRLISGLAPGVHPPMWFNHECGHSLNEAMYDLAHDYDPAMGMMGGLIIRDKLWTGKLKAIRTAPAGEQAGLYRDIQRDILEFAPCVHIAEVQTGWVARGAIDPWTFGPDCLALTTTVWSGHRQIMGYW